MFYWCEQFWEFWTTMPLFYILIYFYFYGRVLGPVMQRLICILSSIFTIFKWKSTFFYASLWYFIIFLAFVRVVKHCNNSILFFWNNYKFFYCLSKHYVTISSNILAYSIFYFCIRNNRNLIFIENCWECCNAPNEKLPYPNISCYSIIFVNTSFKHFYLWIYGKIWNVLSDNINFNISFILLFAYVELYIEW